MRVVSEIDQASLYNLLLTNLQPTNLCQECVICAEKPTAAPSKEAIVCRAPSPDYSPTYNGPGQNLVVAPKPALLVFAPKPSPPEWPPRQRNKKKVSIKSVATPVRDGFIFTIKPFLLSFRKPQGFARAVRNPSCSINENDRDHQFQRTEYCGTSKNLPPHRQNNTGENQTQTRITTVYKIISKRPFFCNETWKLQAPNKAQRQPQPQNYSVIHCRHP